MVSSFYLGLVLTSLAAPALAHIALWDPALFGWDPNNPNQQDPINPLMNLNFDQWWFHGYNNQPPANGTLMTLPSGGTYHGQVACNKALTTYGDNPAQQTGIYACDGSGPQGGIGAMHTSDQWGSSDPKDVKGCGIAIAYTSDAQTVQPEDFAVISINYTCPWKKDVDFQIPSDLPPCPAGGCLCSWGWIHADDAGSEQMYHLVYRCTVDGATGTTPIPSPKTANKCPVDKSNCTVGAKQPHYWFQNERNNNPQGQYDPPFFNGDYGFMNGAQTDLFATVGGASNESTNASSPAPASSSSTSTTAAAAAPTTSATGASTPTTSLSSSLTTQDTAANPTGGSSSSSASSSTSTGSSSGSSCKRRKRAFDELNSSPAALKRHRERNARRSKRKAQANNAKRTSSPDSDIMRREGADLRKFAKAQRRWEEEQLKKRLSGI